MPLASQWSAWPYGVNTAGVELVGAEVCSWPLKSFSQKARPEKTGDWGRFLQSFKVHHNPLGKRDTGPLWVMAIHFHTSKVPLNSDSWSCGQVLWKTSCFYQGLERDHCWEWTPSCSGMGGQASSFLSGYLQPYSFSRTPPALPRTTLKWLNLPVAPVNPVK